MYICTYICSQTYTYNIYIHKYIYIYIFTYMYIYTCDSWYKHIYTRVDIASNPCVVDKSVPNRPPRHCKSLAH